MAVPSDVFKFPIRKFDDDIGLHKNFRYMEDFFETLNAAGSRSATRVIASSTTSSQKSIDGADHLASGVADQVKVQAAIDAMPSAGGSLYFAEGQYEMSGHIQLPASDIVLYGPGTLNFTGASTAFNNAFDGTENGNYAFTGLTMTGALRVSGASTRGAKLMTGGQTSGGTRWTVTGCKFINLSADVFFGTKDISHSSEFVITGNYFEGIELRRGTSASGLSFIIGVKGASRSAFGMFSGNYLDGLTTNNGGGSNDNYYIARSAEPNIFVNGNVFKNVSGLTANFGDSAVDSHNVINDTMVGGDHTGFTIAHSATTGRTSDDHHAQAHTVASHSDTTATGAETETLTDGSDADALHAHPIHTLADGTRAFSGNQSFGDNNITNVGAIDLDTIRAGAANGPVTIELDNAAGADLLVGNNNALVVEGDSDRVGVGIAAPLAKVHVVQGSTSGAQPVLTLNQADVDEDYLKIIGTSDTSADRALVDAANFTTPGAIVGWLKINVQDDQATAPIVDGDYYVPFYAVPTA